MMNNNKFYKIGVAVSVLLIGVIVACIVIAQKQDDKVAKAEDFPSVSSSTNVVENEVNVAEQTDFEEIAKVEENKNTENDSKNVTTKNNKTENTTSDKSAQNTTSKKSNDTKNQNKKSTEQIEYPFCTLYVFYLICSKNYTLLTFHLTVKLRRESFVVGEDESWFV